MKRGIDYDHVISLFNSIMKRIDYLIDNNYNFDGQVVVFENENYIVNENVTEKIIKERKALTAFTEKLVIEVLEKFGYTIRILLPDPDPFKYGPGSPYGMKDNSGNQYGKPDKLSFCISILQGKEMLYYNTTFK